MSFIEQRGLTAAAQRMSDRPHGTRLRYLAGCKCFHCRRANSDYERERQKARERGDWNGIVDAAGARAHLRRLSRQGVGKRIVHAVSDVSVTGLQEIRAGRKTRIRARTERRILAVTPAARGDATLIPAGPTWQRIEWLLEEGFTKGRIALELGRVTPALQINRRTVTVRTAARVEALVRRYQQ
jgi:hypothetical protein